MRPGFARTVTRAVLLGPAAVRNAAARRATATAEERWMLTRPRHVRESYVREVLVGDGEDPRAREIWMLRQDDATRESYVQQVLLGEDA
jgi:hypothetical protein